MDAELIKKYKNINWDLFLRNDVQNYNFGNYKIYFDKIKNTFDLVIDYCSKNNNFYNIPNDYGSTLETLLRELNSLYEDIINLKNFEKREDFLKRIKELEFNSWKGLKDFIQYIKFNDKEEKPKLPEELMQKINEANEIAINLINNQEKYKSATNLAENWLQKQANTVSVSVDDKAKIFDTKSEEHKKIWGWFAGALVFVAIALFFIFFIYKKDINLSVGSAMIRISTLLILSYLIFFCLQQYSNHRKLYEIYRFKFIALNTLNELYKSYIDNENAKREILVKGINIIFAEPVLEENTQFQQKVIEQTMDIIKKKI